MLGDEGPQRVAVFGCPARRLPAASARRIGGLPGRRSTSGSNVGDEGDIRCFLSVLRCSVVRVCGVPVMGVFGAFGLSSVSSAVVRRERGFQEPRQVREDGMTGDVLEGDRPVQGDRELHGRERGAAAVEEVVEAADPAAGDAEDLGPGSRQPPLARECRARADPPRRANRSRRSRAPRRARSASSGRSCRWRSAAGSRASGRPTGPCRRAAKRPAAPARPRSRSGSAPVQNATRPRAPHDHHGAVPYPGHPQQRVLDLADLDTEAADLDLAVPAAEELQPAVGQPAAVVAAAVEPLTRAVRVGGERRPGPLGVVDVPAADADPGEDDLAGRAEGYGG